MLRKAYTPARLLAEGVLLIAAGMLLFFYPASSGSWRCSWRGGFSS